MAINSHIIHVDEYKIFEKLASDSKKIGTIGFVRAFENGKEFFNGYNLVVAQGREFAAQKLFEVVDTPTGVMDTIYNHKISHFAMGAGGISEISGTNVTLNGPMITDTGLYAPIKLGNTSYLNEPSNIQPAGQSPIVYSYQNAVKPIESDGGGIILQPVSYADSVYRYTQVKCTCVLASNEPTSLLEGQSVPISEAGLYFVNEAYTDIRMFAHICFPPKYKESGAVITLHWYILC